MTNVMTNAGLRCPAGKALVARADRDSGIVLQNKDAKPEEKDKALFVRGLVRWNQGRLDEGVEFIQKPMTQADLSARVRQILDGSPGRP